MKNVKEEQELLFNKNKLIILESVVGFGVGFHGGLIGLALGSIHMPAMILVLKKTVTAGKYDNNSVTRIKNSNIK